MKRKMMLRLGGVAILVTGIMLLLTIPAVASTPGQSDDPVERGEYIAIITGCWGCHTPRDPETFQMIEEMSYAGGQVFDLGPLGQVMSPNLTSDPETGLGNWTDEQIKIAIKTGISPDGYHNFPVMPYTTFQGMSDQDLDDLVTFLRSLEPIENEVPREQVVPSEALPQIPYQEGIEAPDPSNIEARAQYLFSGLLACTDCHTPVDPETGEPEMDKFLAGGQPYEGPWGVVYGGNITPHDETGIGTWSDEDIERVLRTGIRPDGRAVVLMPWEDYTVFTEEDMDAVIYYLKNDVEPVNREVPASSLNEEFVRYVEIPEVEDNSNHNLMLLAGIAIGIVLVGAIVFFAFRSSSSKKSDGSTV